jgi:tRNA G10  N-methylase Trm11
MSKRIGRPRMRAGHNISMFATAIPGLGPIVTRELAALPGVLVRDTGSDGRSDIVVFEVARGSRGAVRALRLAEDIFLEVGSTTRSQGDKAGSISERIWRPDRVQRILSVWADEVRPLRAAMTFRVIARVLQERSFIRTELRQKLTDTISQDRPRWRLEDPAQIEVWISEYAPGRFIAGLRLSDVSMRQHQGRLVERAGALRPTLASAMVSLAGEPDGLLLDPCCGSGTILSEAIAAGWEATGIDIDQNAVSISRKNVPSAQVELGDARNLSLPDASARACVSNLPFGRQYDVQGNMETWLHSALSEIVRVVRTEGRVVLLSPRITRAVVPPGLRTVERFPVRLLGTKTTIWVFARE